MRISTSIFFGGVSIYINIVSTSIFFGAYCASNSYKRKIFEEKCVFEEAAKLSRTPQFCGADAA